jgi:hypothetical protein
MKKLAVFLCIVLITPNSLFGQFLTLNSKDSLNNKPKRQFYTTAWVKLNGIWDYMGISNTAAMNLPEIPTDGRPPDSHFTMDMYQTRLKFASTFQTERFGEIFSYIETDFYGNNGGGLRLRHAYIRFKNWRIGQTWSSFTDEESWPNVTDFDGPPTGSWVRHVQIGYFIRPSEMADILISVESPYADYNRYLELDSTLESSSPSYPDLHSHFEQRWSKGHIQVAGVYRIIEYKNNQDANSYVSGYGINLSLAQTIAKRDKAIGQLVVGKGISRYLVSLAGAGWDAAPDANGSFIALPVWGGYLSYQHFWGNSDFSSTAVAGYSAVTNPLNNPSRFLFRGISASANIYWQPLGPLSFALEGIYGVREDEFENMGDNYRLQFVFEYAF